MSQSEDHEALIEAVARAMFESRHKGLSNCYPWDDTDMDHDNPDVRPALYRDARAAIAIIAKTLETVTPEMRKARELALGGPDADWRAMLRASLLFPGEEQ